MSRERLDGKALAKFDTLSAAEQGMSETGREFYWVAPDGRVYESVTFSDGACWLNLHADTIKALFDLQSTLEFFEEGQDDGGSFKALVRAATETEAAFRKCLEAVKFKPLKQEKF